MFIKSETNAFRIGMMITIVCLLLLPTDLIADDSEMKINFHWVDKTRYVLKPTVDQERIIEKAVNENKSQVTVKLTKAQMQLFRKVFGLTSTNTTVQLPKNPPSNFEIILSPDKKYIFDEKLYVTECKDNEGKIECNTVRRVILRVVTPFGTFPTKQEIDEFIFEPFFDMQQRQTFERAVRDGLEKIVLNKRSSESAGTQNPNFNIKLLEPCILSFDVGTLGCWTECETYCRGYDRFGNPNCSMLCKPVCD